MKIDLKIKYTKDYNKFKFIESINRSVDPKHVQKMAKKTKCTF